METSYSAHEEVLSYLQQSWRDDGNSNSIREALITLSSILSQQDEPRSSFTTKNVQKGLYRILQRHYASYKKEGKERYSGFGTKYSVLLETVSQTFSNSDDESSENVLKAFSDSEEEGVQVLITLFQTVLDRHSDLFLSTLHCLHQISRSGETKAKVLQIILSRLPLVDISQLHSTLSILGDFPLDNMESMQTISTIRKLWGKLEKEVNHQYALVRFAHNIVQWFSKEWNGHFLASAYLQSVDESSSSSEGVVSSLDLIVLLSLSVDLDFGKQVNEILDSWISLSHFFDLLGQTLCLVKVEESPMDDMDWLNWDFYRQLVSPITTLAIRQLRTASAKYAQPLEVFCVNMFENFLFDCDRPTFVDSIVQLWREMIYFNRNGDNTVPKALYNVMLRLSQRATTTMAWNRSAFIEALESPTILSASVAADISAIVVPLFGLDDQDELIYVVDRLLFTPAESRFDSRIANGIILATEIIRNQELSSAMSEALESRVLRILLPNDRRVVPPELGSPGLEFLESHPGNSSMVFRNVQMILANTGLIQRLSSYQQVKRKYVATLGYASKKSSCERKNDFIFCAAFFLKQIDHTELRQWDSTVRWVFDLVNSYIASGRHRSRTAWNPRGWLQATVEFPRLTFPFKTRGQHQKNVVDWLLSDFGTFDIGLTRTSPPPANFRTIYTDILVRNPDGLAILQDVLLKFTLGLLLGISLSAGVLKNAFAHYNDTTDESKRPDLLKLIECQIMKIYHLKDKLTDLENMLVPFESALRKLNTEAKLKSSTAQCDQDSLLANIIRLKETSGKICDSLFYTTNYIDREVLWESLADQRSIELLKAHLRFLLSISSPTERRPSTDEVADVIHTRCKVASQLLYSSCSSGLGPREFVTRLASFTFFVVPLLPKLRGALTAMDSPPLEAWIRYAAVSIQLLTLCFAREIEYSSDTAFMVRAISSSILPDIPSPGSLPKVIDSLQQILSAADDVHVANGLLDMLSILGSQNHKVLQSVTLASTEAIHKAFTNSGETTNVTELPYSVSVLTKSLKGPANALPTFRKSLETTLCRTPSPRTRTIDTFWVHRYSLLRHFGLLVQNGVSTSELESFYTGLSFEIESILDWVSRKSQTHSVKRGIASDVKQLPKRPVCSFPSLTANNFAEFFETVLHMIVGALVLYPPVTVTDKNGVSGYPYQKLEMFLRHFYSLSLLFTKYFAQFPRKIVGVMYSTVRQLMDVAILQLNRCADWRRSFQMPKGGIGQQNDPGSLRFLGQLVKSFRELIVGGLSKIAEVWTADKAPQVTSKGKNLVLLIDRFSSALEDVSLRHRLSHVEEATSSAWVESKRRRVGDHLSSSQGECTNYKETELFDEDYMDGSEDNDNEEDDDESFGAAGEWGNNKNRTDDDSVDSAEPITISLAT